MVQGTTKKNWPWFPGEFIATVYDRPWSFVGLGTETPLGVFLLLLRFAAHAKASVFRVMVIYFFSK